ncbi:MAG: restriction endonuclease subunit S [Ferrimicrobium sp.]
MGQSPAGSTYNSDGRGLPLIQGNADIRCRVTFDRIWTTAPTKRCFEGDVLLTVRAPVGYTAIASKDACLGRDVCALSSHADNRFLYHLLVYREPRWQAFEQGSTFTAVNSNEVRQFSLSWPTNQNERKAIAETLDKTDDLISTLERLIKKKEAIKQGMMQELLTGRTRLPGFGDAWASGTFNDLATPAKERILPAKVDPSTLLVELDQIESGTGRLVGRAAATGAISFKTVFRAGDVLFGKLRAYLRKFWLAETDGLCSTEIWALRPTPGVSSEFVRYIVETDGLIEVASGAYGTHMPRSDWGSVRRYQLSIPRAAEQDQIATVLCEVDIEIELFRKRLNKARAIKQGMMQQLLTGRIRLPVAETMT